SRRNRAAADRGRPPRRRTGRHRLTRRHRPSEGDRGAPVADRRRRAEGDDRAAGDAGGGRGGAPARAVGLVRPGYHITHDMSAMAKASLRRWIPRIGFIVVAIVVAAVVVLPRLQQANGGVGGPFALTDKSGKT